MYSLAVTAYAAGAPLHHMRAQDARTEMSQIAVAGILGFPGACPAQVVAILHWTCYRHGKVGIRITTRDWMRRTRGRSTH